MLWTRRFIVFIAIIALWKPISHGADENTATQDRLPDTGSLAPEGDMADRMVSGIDRFLLNKIIEAAESRREYWSYDFASSEAYIRSVEENRRELARILGVRDPRMEFAAPQLPATTDRPALLAENDNVQVFAVRWPVLGYPGPNNQPGVAVHGEGLLLIPVGGESVADVVALPDADQSPEAIAGLSEELPRESRFALRLAERGCRVLVPTLIGRDMKIRGGNANMTDREFLYRPAFELGRGLIGYELQKALAAVDWFERDSKENHKIGIIGYGEGGMLALYAAAIDPRIDAALVSGYFGPHDQIWNEPISRNVFGRLTRFGDAEIATLIAPRTLMISAAGGPELTLPSEGGAPAILKAVPKELVRAEVERARQLISKLGGDDIHLSDDDVEDAGPVDLDDFMSALGIESTTASAIPLTVRRTANAKQRHARQFQEIKRHTQWLLAESPYVREEFMAKLDTQSLDAFKESIEPYREIFYHRIIGKFNEPLSPPRPRSRKVRQTEHWTEYDVVLDVFPDVIAYGKLLIPKDLQPGEKRPVVVFQHGLEGRPEDVVAGDHRAYHDVSARLAERGFVTFSPQNPYIFQDRFRTLQRKSNAIGKTLFSTIIPQHQQIVDWLQTLPFTDGERIGFYGLSYGGKTAMRVPAVVTDYKLSICSADFNDWIWKNASTRSKYSYVWTKEYEIFEFDLGATFNYSDMAALICPRPFMVERGHFDGVAPDARVAAEFAKVRHLYAAELGIGDRCEIEWFVGPHTVNGQGTFEFLHEHLGRPLP